MSSTRESVVRISSAPRSGSATAASSPMPTVSQAGGGGTRARISAISPRSPCDGGGVLSGELNSPCFTDDGDLDLAGILQLVLDSLGDVFRKPHSLLVRHLFAFDDDADFAAGLKRERFRNALERVSDALELFEALHVRLEDVPPRARACGGD